VAVADQQGISGALTKYVIPAAEIGRVRDQLDLVGIDERRLFPRPQRPCQRIARYYGRSARRLFQVVSVFGARIMDPGQDAGSLPERTFPNRL
jgi:hypothetical protein